MICVAACRSPPFIVFCCAVTFIAKKSFNNLLHSHSVDALIWNLLVMPNFLEFSTKLLFFQARLRLHNEITRFFYKHRKLRIWPKHKHLLSPTLSLVLSYSIFSFHFDLDFADDNEMISIRISFFFASLRSFIVNYSKYIL